MKTDQTEIGYFFSKTFFALISAAAIFSLLFFPKSVGAAVKCEVQYGGTQVCVTTGQVQVNKEVFDPQNKKFVDNLGINDHKFSPGELISFRISVKNVGDATLGTVTVTDIPQAGFLDLATGALNFNLTNLAPGETKQQELKFRVANASQFPQNNMICIINAAEVNADNGHDRDTAQLCLERQVLGKGVVEIPKTGLSTVNLLVSGLFLLAGFRLRKFSFWQNSANNICQMRNSKRGRR